MKKIIYLKTNKNHDQFVCLITQSRALGIWFKKRYGFTKCDIRSGTKPEHPEQLLIKYTLSEHINDIAVISEQV